MKLKQAIAIVAGAGTGVLLGKKLKEKEICPLCVAKKAIAATPNKRFLVFNSLVLTSISRISLAPKPLT